MDKVELARRLARLSRRSRGRMADELDALIYELLPKTKAPVHKAEEGQAREARSSAPREKH